MDTIQLGHLTYQPINEDTEYSVIKCDGDAVQVEIPFSVNQLPVTEIGQCAFRNCRRLESVTLPAASLYVAPYAFSGCTSLKTVTPIRTISKGVFEDCRALRCFPVADGTTVIEEDAFRGCYSLVDITIPGSVTSIEPLAFRSCRGLKHVMFENPNGWRYTNLYTGKRFELDLSDSGKNAEFLSKIDFDDGIGTWHRY